MRIIFCALVTILSVGPLSSASAAVVFDTSLAPPGYYNGTGPVDGHFAVDTENGVEAAIRAEIRGSGPITPTGNLYLAPTGTDAAGTHALWNFDYSVNPGSITGTSATIVITNLANNQTATINDNSVTRVPVLLNDGTNGNGYQNSETLNFSFLKTPLLFDPNANDTYKIVLTVFDANNLQLASIDELVQIGSGVPEPTTWALMLIGFLGVGYMAYRRKQSLPQFV